MNAHSLMMNAATSFMPTVASNNWMDQVSHSLGISGDPQGFFLYLLIMVGIFVVISILVYNWLEERRFNKQVESNFSSIEEDALLDDKQQQFFDKFASTTGVLNDQPPEGTFIDENGEALEDDRSIEDVYAELLETMSKRNRKEKVEPEGVVIDHQNVEVDSEPVLEMPVDVLEADSEQEPTLYIPEAAEVTDAEIVDADIIETPPIVSPDDSALNLTFETSDSVSMPTDIVPKPDAVTSEANLVDVSTTSVESVEQEQDKAAALDDIPAATPEREQDNIKAIINRAFKEKYNPNFKAEQEQSADENKPNETESVVEEAEVEVAEPDAEIETEAPMETLEVESVPEHEPELTQDIPALTDPVVEEPPIVTESVEAVEAPVLNFPVEEPPQQIEPPLPELQNDSLNDEAPELDFLKGLDEAETPNVSELPVQEPAAPEPPILDNTVSEQSEPAESNTPLSQTYQQLLNRDDVPNTSDDEIASPIFTPNIPQEEAAVSTGEAASASNTDEERVADKDSTKQAQESPDPASLETTSVFTDALPAHLNPHIDFIGTIEAGKGSNAAFILESFSTFHQQFEFPVFVFMQCQQSQWLLLNDVTEVEISRYLERNHPVHITASIQMADRTGPISRNTIQRFKQSLSEVAVTMGASVQWVDPTEPIDRAASLDAFCIEVDKTMFFHLANTQTPFTGIKLKGLVETQGMVLERDGAYKYYDLNTDSGMKRGVPDFVLFNRDNHKFTEEMLRSSVIKAVTMQLDIPLIPTSAAALDRMVVIAQSLESSLNAKLVDDKNRLITDVHLARIREQIKSIHAAMQLRGITPGSTHAQRLFS